MHEHTQDLFESTWAVSRRMRKSLVPAVLIKGAPGPGRGRRDGVTLWFALCYGVALKGDRFLLFAFSEPFEQHHMSYVTKKWN